MVQDGRVKGRVHYAYDGRTVTQDTEWVPARFSKGFGDIEQGKINLDDSMFKSHSGHAQRGENGNVILHVHGNLSFALAVTGGK